MDQFTFVGRLRTRRSSFEPTTAGGPAPSREVAGAPCIFGFSAPRSASTNSNTGHHETITLSSVPVCPVCPSRVSLVSAGWRPLRYRLGSCLQCLESCTRWRLDSFEMAATPARAAYGGPSALGVLGCPCALITPRSLADCARFSRVISAPLRFNLCVFSRLFAAKQIRIDLCPFVVGPFPINCASSWFALPSGKIPPAGTIRTSYPC